MATRYIISFKNRQGVTGYVTKICPCTIKYSSTIESPQVLKVDDAESYKIMAALQRFGIDDIERIDASPIERKSHRRYPVIKVDAGSKFAETYGIQDWHHLHIRGELIFVVVWDTRMLDQVIQLADVPAEFFKDTYFIEDDNHKPLRLPSYWHEADAARYRMEYKSMPEITDEQFNNIRTSK